MHGQGQNVISWDATVSWSVTNASAYKLEYATNTGASGTLYNGAASALLIKGGTSVSGVFNATTITFKLTASNPTGGITVKTITVGIDEEIENPPTT
jgi:hypothetical protein